MNEIEEPEQRVDEDYDAEQPEADAMAEDREEETEENRQPQFD